MPLSISGTETIEQGNKAVNNEEINAHSNTIQNKEHCTEEIYLAVIRCGDHARFYENLIHQLTLRLVGVLLDFL